MNITLECAFTFTIKLAVMAIRDNECGRREASVRTAIDPYTAYSVHHAARQLMRIVNVRIVA